MATSLSGRKGRKLMPWRLYDTMNSRWYNDELFDTQEACEATANHYIHEARITGGTLELLAKPISHEGFLESLAKEEEEQ
jgi:hypothetical protein